MLPVLLSSFRALEAIFHHVGNAPTPAADDVVEFIGSGWGFGAKRD
jgi:hypothetical protein